ncbi:unnamed protein product [Ectocarpus sp. CCAP 1310/34]|nr:unnamed protein product [Ectocarpus sp. CCAP 1310/34]
MKSRASSLAAVLFAVTPANVGAFVPSSVRLGSCFGRHACKVKAGEWGCHDGPCRGAMLARRARRWSTMTAAQEESAEASDESGGSSSKHQEEEDGEDAVWARAELPMSNDVQVEQATRAVWQALSDGKTRQILRLSLPLIGKTEIDDWPGGDRQRYKACGPMVESVLRGNPAAKEGASIVEQILDESDAVGLMQLQCKEAKDDASVMIFPTTDTLSLQQQVAAGAGSRLVALVNPAWRSSSDFGLFQAGEAEETLSEFEVTYSLQSLVVYGYTLRLLYCYPGPWRLFLIGEGSGKRELLGSWDRSPPTNDQVESAVFDKKGKPNASERVQASAKFFQDSL